MNHTREAGPLVVSEEKEEYIYEISKTNLRR